jgi:transcriptional regulator with XRE-family HTH domain
MKLSELIRELRRRLGWTQQKLAVAVNVAVRTISVYETGDTTGSPEVIGRFREIADRHNFKDLAAEFHTYSQFPGHGTVTLRHVESLRDSCTSLHQQLAEASEGIRRWTSAASSGEGLMEALKRSAAVQESLEPHRREALERSAVQENLDRGHLLEALDLTLKETEERIRKMQKTLNKMGKTWGF